jgi:hypothetical protein
MFHYTHIYCKYKIKNIETYINENKKERGRIKKNVARM